MHDAAKHEREYHLGSSSAPPPAVQRAAFARPFATAYTIESPVYREVNKLLREGPTKELSRAEVTGAW